MRFSIVGQFCADSVQVLLVYQCIGAGILPTVQSTLILTGSFLLLLTSLWITNLFVPIRFIS